VVNMNVRAINALDNILNEELTFGSMIKNIRETEYEGMTQIAFSEKVLGLSKSRLSDIENDRKMISIPKAIEFAGKLNQSKRFFVTIAMQDMVKKSNLDYVVRLEDCQNSKLAI